MYCEIKDDLVGNKIKAISLSADKEEITIELEPDIVKKYGVEGDCCSQSWIEYLNTPNNIEGATIIDVVDSDRVRDEEKDKSCCEKCKDSDSLAVYQTFIKTDKGDIALEYRNDSNGYYGGYIVSR